MNPLSINQVCDRLSSVTPYTIIELSKMSITEIKILCKKFLDKELTFVLKGESSRFNLSIDADVLAKYKADTAHVSELQTQMVREVAKRTDELIRKAINKYLGDDTWAMEDIIGRGEMKCVNDTDYLYMDGELILELYPYESQYDITRPEDTSYMMNMNRKYRMYV